MLNELSRKDIELLNILAKTPEGKSALDEYIEQHKKAVKAYKAYRESVVAEVVVPKVEKSANELRAEIIEKAKDFVEIFIARGRCSVPVVEAEFVITEDKKTVEVLMKGVSTGKVRFKGIAKCNPADVFNEHIGKAIALGRALDKDVSEFENAVQPTEPVVGHVVKGYEALGFYRQDRKFTLTSKKDCDSFYYPECNEYDTDSHNDFIYNWQIGAIIDDTNAQYKN